MVGADDFFTSYTQWNIFAKFETFVCRVTDSRLFALKPPDYTSTQHNCCFSQVIVGTNINEVLDDTLPFKSAVIAVDSIPISVIVPALLVPVLVILLIAVVCVVIIVLVVRKKYRTKELHLTTVLELQTTENKNASE